MSDHCRLLRLASALWGKDRSPARSSDEQCQHSASLLLEHSDAGGASTASTEHVPPPTPLPPKGPVAASAPIHVRSFGWAASDQPQLPTTQETKRKPTARKRTASKASGASTASTEQVSAKKLRVSLDASVAVVGLKPSNVPALVECRGESDRSAVCGVPAQVLPVADRTLPNLHTPKRLDRRAVRRSYGPAPIAHPNIQSHFKPWLRAGRATRHAEYVINKVLDSGVSIFKIGMTSDPKARFESYCGEFETMHLLHACSTLEGSWFLEAHLISVFGEMQGSLHKARGDIGGEGNPPNGRLWYFVYLAHCRTENYLKRVREAAARKKALANTRADST
jgi:hypothetical protein